MCIYAYARTHTHTHTISNYVEIVYIFPLLRLFSRETFLHKSVAVRSVDWIFIRGAPAWW
jgi:hypothetical protein